MTAIFAGFLSGFAVGVGLFFGVDALTGSATAALVADAAGAFLTSYAVTLALFDGF